MQRSALKNAICTEVWLRLITFRACKADKDFPIYVKPGQEMFIPWCKISGSVFPAFDYLKTGKKPIHNC